VGRTVSDVGGERGWRTVLAFQKLEVTVDPHLRQHMLDYYNERAPEYEEAYTLGTGPHR